MPIRLDYFSKVILVATFLFGLPFLILGGWEAAENLQMANSFVKTRATVVNNAYSTTNIDGNVSGAYYPVVEFFDLDGKKVRVTEGIGSLPADFQIGERIEIYFDPHDSTKVRINTWKRLWLVPTIFGTVGILPLLIGIIVVGKIESAFVPK